MKKLILLFSVIALTLSSCSSDDDSSSSQDQLIGTWKYYKYFENGVEIALDPCEDQNTFQVLSNGNFVDTYYDDDGNGNCIDDGNSTGTWENVGSGFYSTTETGGTPDVEEVTFSGDTFYYEDTETFNGVTTTYRDVFKRQ